MVPIAGLLTVIISIIVGYLWEGGNMGVLMQPAELVIIGGAAMGGLICAAGPKTLKDMVKQVAGLPKGGRSKGDYRELLLVLYELLNLSRREGLLALESHVENPEASEIFKKYPSFVHDHHAVSFLCDTLRLILTGADVQAHDLEALMDADLETHHAEELRPSQMIMFTGDSLPGLGIVAAVLGIVITMGAINGPPEVIGHKIGAALVGTFLGILLSYGFFQPIATNLAAKVDANGRYYAAIKQVLLAFHKGCSPAVSVEFARRSITSDVRPTYAELEEAFRSAKTGGG